MNARGFRRYIDDLAAGRRPEVVRTRRLRGRADPHRHRPAGRTDGRRRALRQEFLADLHSRLAAQMEGEPEPTTNVRRLPTATRREVVVGTSAAAAAAVAAVAVDRMVIRDDKTPDAPATGGELTPNKGSWQAVGKCSEIAEDGVMHPFDVGSVIGFVRRVDGQPEAVSGGLHAPGVPAVVRQARYPAALPVPLDVVLAGGAGADPSAVHLACAAAEAGRARDRRCDPGVRTG